MLDSLEPEGAETRDARARFDLARRQMLDRFRALLAFDPKGARPEIEATRSAMRQLAKLTEGTDAGR